MKSVPSNFIALPFTYNCVVSNMGGSHSVHCERPATRTHSALRKFSVGSLKILRASMGRLVLRIEVTTVPVKALEPTFALF